MLSTAELDHIAGSFGDHAMVGTAIVPGRFTQPHAELSLLEGTAPAFTTSRSRIEAAAITRDTVITSVRTYTGQLYGPFRVKFLRNEDDGEIVELGLERT